MKYTYCVYMSLYLSVPGINRGREKEEKKRENSDSTKRSIELTQLNA